MACAQIHSDYITKTAWKKNDFFFGGGGDRICTIVIDMYQRLYLPPTQAVVHVYAADLYQDCYKIPQIRSGTHLTKS